MADLVTKQVVKKINVHLKRMNTETFFTALALTEL